MKDASPTASGAASLLGGLRVVEIGESLAGSMVGMLLAEQGAEVVRVLSAHEPPRDPVLEAILSRGKTEVTLDLMQAESKAAVSGLLAHADVVLENYAPGTRAELDLDFEQLRRGPNPGLISCTLPAFPAGDERASVAGHEAIAGMAGFVFTKPFGKPRQHAFPIASVTAALYAANAIVAALIARLRLGCGQHVEVSLYGSGLFSQILQVLAKTGLPRAFLPLKMVGTPFVGVWRCADGRYIFLHLTVPAHNARALDLLAAAGCERDVAELRRVLSPDTVRDPSQVKSIKEAKRITTILERIFLAKTADEWEAVFGKDLCGIKVRTAEEWMRDSAAAGMDDVCRVHDPVFGELTAPGPAVVAPARPPALKSRVLARGGVSELLARWERSSAVSPLPAVAAGGDKADPVPTLAHALDGVRVFDMSRVIAGPYAGRVLAEFGAEVLSVQSPTNLDWALSFHLIFNAGKRSVTLDFSHDEGKRKLWKLLEHHHPDVLLQNYRSLELARAIGVDFDTVHGRLPDTVCTFMNAYGVSGEWQNRPAFEQVVQAVTGIQTAYAEKGKPKLLPIPILDLGSGLLGGFASLLGLYHQRQGGSGSFVTAHMTGMAMLLQVASIAEVQRDACLARAKAAGESISFAPERQIVSRLWKAKDGYAAVAGPYGDLVAWLEGTGLTLGADESQASFLSRAERHFRKRKVAAWQGTLIETTFATTVGVMPSLPMRSLFKKRSVQVEKRLFPGLREVTFVRSPVRLSKTPLRDIAPPPVRGTHSREVLAEIGETLPEGAGVLPYPRNKPLIIWLIGVIRWGIYALRSGRL